MSAVQTLGTAVKPSAARVRVPCDFGDSSLLIDGYSIVSYSVTCSGSGAPTVSGVQMDYSYQTSALLSGGTPGTYDITFTITLNDPDATILSCTGTIKIL